MAAPDASSVRRRTIRSDLPVWISLGGGCRVAYQLRRWRLRAAPTPFDWIRTPVAAVIQLIAGDFSGFLNEHDLHLHEGPPRVLRDRRLGIVLPHDVDTFVAGGAPALHARFQPRIEAFRSALDTRKHVVFVRRGLERDDAEALLEVLRRRRPGLRVTVIGVHDAADAPRAMTRHGDFLRISAPGRRSGWSGCDAAWDWILDTALKHALAVAPPRSLPWVLLGRDWVLVETGIRHLLAVKGPILDRIPPVLLAALVAAEDHRFYRHGGVDWVATSRALLGLITGRRLGGGSTIEQQLYRTLTNRRERTVTRKLREMIGARFLGWLLDKDILASLYLTSAYFGAHMNGLEQACQRLKLRLPEMRAADAAALVARLKYPEPRVAGEARRRQIERRAEWVLERMNHEELR